MVDKLEIFSNLLVWLQNIQNNSYARAVSNRGEGIVNNKDILMSEMIKQISQMNVHLNTLVNSNY